jgi:hypothetical protein
MKTLISSVEQRNRLSSVNYATNEIQRLLFIITKLNEAQISAVVSVAHLFLRRLRLIQIVLTTL